MKETGASVRPSLKYHSEGGTKMKHDDHDIHVMHDAADAMPHAGHDKHAGHSVAMFRDKFWITLLLTLPTLVWGHMLQSTLGGWLV